MAIEKDEPEQPKADYQVQYTPPERAELEKDEPEQPKADYQVQYTPPE